MASVRVILSAKAVWAAAKDADVAEKVRTASIIARKSLREYGDMLRWRC